jgi:phosphatidylserine decarboxylase
VDPRDLKLYRNVCRHRFPPQCDRFAWRGRLPFARQGLVEVVVMGVGGLLAAIALLFVAPLAALLPAIAGVFYLWFFRDPNREVPRAPDIVVAPCDGVVDDICALEHCDVFDGPATRVGISLSLFDVHLNRAPVDAMIHAVRYSPGAFRNAMRKGDHENNEQFWTVFAPVDGAPHLAVRQIAGPMARTIVNEVRVGQPVARGERFGMIKFGSRTELYLPAGRAYDLAVRLGQRVRGGRDCVLRRRDVASIPVVGVTDDRRGLG